MGSSTELQDLVMGEGSKMLIDAASEVSVNQSEARNLFHSQSEASITLC